VLDLKNQGQEVFSNKEVVKKCWLRGEIIGRNKL